MELDGSEGQFGTESCLLNAYGSPVVISESRSVVNRVGNFNFSFMLKCMLLFAHFFPFQFLTKTNKTEIS